MDWKVWESNKAGGAKLSAEEAEQYVTELILSRSIALPRKDGKKAFLCTPAQLQNISRSRRVIQTLGMIVKSRHMEYYYQAVYLLQFLHDLYPNAIPVQDYGKLLVYLKVEAVIFVACCSMSPDRVQVAQCLMTQLFDDYDCESCSMADKQHLEKMHDEGRIKLNQILATNDKLRLTKLSADQLSSQKYHKTMCGILEGFFKGIDDALPPPTIIQMIQDFQKSVKGTTSTENSASKYVAPIVIPTQALMRGKLLPSKQFAPFISSAGSSKITNPLEMTDSAKATDLPKATADLPKTSRHAKMIKPVEESSMIMTSSNMMTDSSKTSTLNKTIAVITPSKTARPSVVVAESGVHKSLQEGTSGTVTSNDSTIQDSRSKIVNLPGSPRTTADSPQPQAISSPMPTKDISDNSDNTENRSSNLKITPTHSHTKRTPVPSRRFVPLVTSMRCRRSLVRPDGEIVNEETQPKIKRLRIALSPLTKEDYMCHLKLTANKTGKAYTSPLQQEEPPQKESESSLPDSVLTGSDKDYEPPSDLDETNMVTRIQRKRKVAPPERYTSFLEDRIYRRDPQNNQERSHTLESENSESIGTVTRIKKRKSTPPVRYAPFAGVKVYWGDPRSYNRERSDTPDSESVISESVTSSIDSDPPLANLHT